MVLGGMPRRRRLVMALAHAQPAILVGLIATDVARQLVGSPVAPVAFGAALTLAVLAYACELWHQRALCARCAAATGGPVQAARRRWWLRLHHWATERFGYCLILVVAPMVTVALDIGAASYPVWALWALVATANLIHRPVQPWCPQCRGWGGGDDDEDHPAPTPVPSGAAEGRP